MASIYELNKLAIKRYKTENNTFDDFPIGSEVKIICRGQDFNFFYGEKGKVIRNSGKYLGITVEFFEPRHFEDGYIQTEFNFEPKDLILLGEKLEEIEKISEEAYIKKDIEAQRSKRFEILDL